VVELAFLAHIIPSEVCLGVSVWDRNAGRDSEADGKGHQLLMVPGEGV